MSEKPDPISQCADYSAGGGALIKKERVYLVIETQNFVHLRNKTVNKFFPQPSHISKFL
jgi:hypothetical protein